LKVEFKSSFEKDLRKVQEKKLKAQVREVIERVERAENIQEIRTEHDSG
jgi:mRNA-degrading endonuclease RelE of RelBE toxin-antitoxin system